MGRGKTLPGLEGGRGAYSQLPSRVSAPRPTPCRARMRGQYSTHRRVRLRPSGCRGRAGETPARFFLCARCRVQVLICSCCDRGQIYCAGDCAHEARRHAQRAAGRRYQTSRRGRFAHASRARRYRHRQKNVTHQGSPPPPPDDLLSPDLAAASKPPSNGDFPGRPPGRCHWCGRGCPQFVRQDFLRRRQAPRTVARYDRGGAKRDYSP